MNLDRFKSHRSGRLTEIWHEDKQRLAFVPKPLPPALNLSTELINALSEADRALGELAGLGRSLTLPSQHLLVGPFIRREAVLSSKIEGTRTDIEGLYSYEAKHSEQFDLNLTVAEQDAHEVSNYVRALEYGFAQQEGHKVDLDLVRELHGILMKDVHQGRANPGEFRTRQNWISSDGKGISTATFVPPPPVEMTQALQELDNYIQQSNELPPLIRLALIHYQFEAIHPFVDGNGRAGRLLVSLLLVHWKLLTRPLLHLSAFIERYRDTYYRLLLAVTEAGEWEEGVIWFIQGVKEEARDAIRRLRALQSIKIDWDQLLSEDKSSKLVRLIADQLFIAPKVTIPFVQRAFKISDYKTAQRAVERLMRLNILRSTDDSSYGRIFAAQAIIDVISE